MISDINLSFADKEILVIGILVIGFLLSAGIAISAFKSSYQFIGIIPAVFYGVAVMLTTGVVYLLLVSLSLLVFS